MPDIFDSLTTGQPENRDIFDEVAAPAPVQTPLSQSGLMGQPQESPADLQGLSPEETLKRLQDPGYRQAQGQFEAAPAALRPVIAGGNNLFGGLGALGSRVVGTPQDTADLVQRKRLGEQAFQSTNPNIASRAVSGALGVAPALAAPALAVPLFAAQGAEGATENIEEQAQQGNAASLPAMAANVGGQAALQAVLAKLAPGQQISEGLLAKLGLTGPGAANVLKRLAVQVGVAAPEGAAIQLGANAIDRGTGVNPDRGYGEGVGESALQNALFALGAGTVHEIGQRGNRGIVSPKNDAEAEKAGAGRNRLDAVSAPEGGSANVEGIDSRQTTPETVLGESGRDPFADPRFLSPEESGAPRIDDAYTGELRRKADLLPDYVRPEFDDNGNPVPQRRRTDEKSTPFPLKEGEYTFEDAPREHPEGFNSVEDLGKWAAAHDPDVKEGTLSAEDMGKFFSGNMKGLEGSGKFKLADVPVSELDTAGQDNYQPEKVSEYSKLPADSAPPAIAGIKDGKLVLVDGNTRVRAAVERGDQTVKAYVPEDYQAKPVALGNAQNGLDKVPDQRAVQTATVGDAGANAIPSAADAVSAAGRAGRAAIPPEARDWSFTKLKKWGKDNGYDMKGVQSLAQVRRRVDQQRNDSLIELPRPPKKARQWNTKQYKYWAEQNGYDTSKMEGAFSIRREIKQQRQDAVREAKGLEPLNRVARDGEVAREELKLVVPPKKSLFSRAGTKTGDTFETLATPLRSRIKDLAPRIYERLALRYFKGGEFVEDALKRSNPALSLMQKEGGADLFFMLRNQDFEGAKTKYPKAAKAIEQIRDELNGVKVYAQEAGVPLGDLGSGYFPSHVKDYNAFRKEIEPQHSGRYDEAFAVKKASLGRDLTEAERADVVNSVINGYGPMNPGARRPGNAKARKFDTLPREVYNRYYDNGPASFTRYVQDMVRTSEVYRLLGRNLKKTDKGGNRTGGIEGQNLDDSLGNLIQQDVAAGKMDPRNQDKVKALLNTLLVGERTSTGGLTKAYKNFLHATQLSHIGSTLNQLNDLGIIIHRSGVGATAKAIRAELTAGDKRVMLSELGITDLGNEFRDLGPLGKITEKALKAVGFSKLDAAMKEINANAAWYDAQSVLKNPDSAAAKRFERDVKPGFSNYDSLVSDLRSGEKTELVRRYLREHVADTQPLDTWHGSEAFLRARNSRILWALKQFGLTQMDFLRRQTVTKMNTPGQRREGLKNLAGLAVLTGLAGVPINLLKDFLQGEDISPDQLPQRFADVWLGQVLLNTYSLKQVSEDPLQAVLNWAAPPMGAAKDISKDLGDAGGEKGLRSLRWVPVIGDLIYGHAGRGAIEQKARETKEYRSDLRGLQSEAYSAFHDGDRETAADALAQYNTKIRVRPANGFKPMSTLQLNRPPVGTDAYKDAKKSGSISITPSRGRKVPDGR